MSFPSWSLVVTAINDRLGTAYHLEERLAGGHQGGAWVVVDRADPFAERGVLTWTTDPGPAARRNETARLVAALRRRGYPTPTWKEWGVLENAIAFAITDFVPGSPASWASVPIDDIVAAVELQTGAAGPSSDSWSHYLAWALTADDGPRGDLALLGAAAEPLLHVLDHAAAGLEATTLPTEVAVHGDLGIDNILVERMATGESRIAFIDIDACGPGTRAIDYAWLYRDAITRAAPTTARRFKAAGQAVAGDDVWRLCLALACLELAAFAARNGTRAQAKEELIRMHRAVSDPQDRC